VDALALVFSDHAGEHFTEVRVLSAGVNVLPAVSLKELCFNYFNLSEAIARPQIAEK